MSHCDGISVTTKYFHQIAYIRCVCVYIYIYIYIYNSYTHTTKTIGYSMIHRVNVDINYLYTHFRSSF